MSKTFPIRLLSLALGSVALCLTACSNEPTDAQIEAWRQEAIAQNDQIAAFHTNSKEQQEWHLDIHGQTKNGKSVKLTWQQLQSLATTHVPTTDLNHPANLGEVFDFRGVSVATLLDRFSSADPNPEITFVAFDAFRSTVQQVDARRYPIILALERNGKPLARDEGGPLYLVFPQVQYPELRSKYDDQFWAFYVTDLIIGTEPVKLKVGGQYLDAAALEKLPQVTIETEVNYKIAWPTGKVKLQGVRLRDVLATARVKLPADSAVVVRGKSPIYRNGKNPISLPAAAVQNCNLLLVTRWGENRQLIPAKMGGPLALAYPKDCAVDIPEKRWVTLVEELEVTAN